MNFESITVGLDGDGILTCQKRTVSWTCVGYLLNRNGRILTLPLERGL